MSLPSVGALFLGVGCVLPALPGLPALALGGLLAVAVLAVGLAGVGWWVARRGRRMK